MILFTVIQFAVLACVCQSGDPNSAVSFSTSSGARYNQSRNEWIQILLQEEDEQPLQIVYFVKNVPKAIQLDNGLLRKCEGDEDLMRQVVGTLFAVTMKRAIWSMGTSRRVSVRRTMNSAEANITVEFAYERKYEQSHDKLFITTGEQTWVWRNRPTAQRDDLRFRMTHNVAHMLGLGHAIRAQYSIMFPNYEMERNITAELSRDDESALSFIYDNDPLAQSVSSSALLTILGKLINLN